MCSLWTVISASRKLTALSLQYDQSSGYTKPPKPWYCAPHGLTSVKLEGLYVSLDWLFLLDGLRELDVDGRSFAGLLRTQEAKTNEVGSFLMQFPFAVPVLCACSFDLLKYGDGHGTVSSAASNINIDHAVHDKRHNFSSADCKASQATAERCLPLGSLMAAVTWNLGLMYLANIAQG